MTADRGTWPDLHPPCTCVKAWKGLGVLYKVNMGKGWVRMTTEPSCPHHGVNRPPLEPVPDD